MQFQDEDRILNFSVDTFTRRGPSIPEEAPFSPTEILQFNRAYRQFLQAERQLDDLTFLNGKPCPVRYNFDPTRPEADRLLVNWDWLMPLFWGPPPGERDLVRPHTIVEFVEKTVRFRKCKVLAGDTCTCGKKRNVVVEPGRECKIPQHFHHFCPAHVSAWITKYLVPALLLKESQELFKEYIGKVHRGDQKIVEYYSSGEQTDTDMLLDSVRDISGSGAAIDSDSDISVRTCSSM